MIGDLEKEIVQQYGDMSVKGIKKYICVTTLLFICMIATGESMELKKRVLLIEEEVGEWVYAGDLKNRSNTFSIEVEKYEEYLFQLSDLLSEGELTENQQKINRQ